MSNETVARVARESYGRLVAILAAQTGDIEAAEDALQGAFLKAVATWQANGVPDSPEAWLITVARNSHRDVFKHRSVVERYAPDLERELASAGGAVSVFEDRRLDLLFVCAHPAIDPAIRSALMLQTVMGLTAQEIAKLSVSSPLALEKRLSRAKQKIKNARVPFSIPDDERLLDRVGEVLVAIYGAFQLFRSGAEGDFESAPRSPDDAIILARLMVARFPSHSEALGLLALFLFCKARDIGSKATNGDYVPLDEQDPRDWDRDILREAESVLATASAQGIVGRFQLEAAIQSAHVARRVHGASNWGDIARLYQGLLRYSYTVGAEVAYINALSNVTGHEAALQELMQRTTERHLQYQPYWAVKAHLLAKCERRVEARTAYATAIGMTVNPGVRGFLAAKRDAL